MFAVCGLQFGRSVQVQHSRQPRHRLHQEFRSVFLLPSSSTRVASFSFLLIYFITVGNSSSETSAEFRVKYVGAIEKLEFNMSKTLQEPLDLIGYIDAAQVRGCGKESVP